MTLTYEIVGSSGDVAEAETLAAAKVAARTLVEDGNQSATVYRNGQQLCGAEREATTVRQWSYHFKDMA